MVVSKSKFTSDTKSAGLDMDDPLFWQKVMPDFITPMLMIQQLQDISNEIFGITSKGPGRGRGRGKWKRKNTKGDGNEESHHTNQIVKDTYSPTIDTLKGGEVSRDEMDVDSNSESSSVKEKNIDTMKEKVPDIDTSDDKKKKKNQLTKTQKRKIAKFMSDLKSMMEGLFDEAEDENLPSDEKSSAQKTFACSFHEREIV